MANRDQKLGRNENGDMVDITHAIQQIQFDCATGCHLYSVTSASIAVVGAACEIDTGNSIVCDNSGPESRLAYSDFAAY